MYAWNLIEIFNSESASVNGQWMAGDERLKVYAGDKRLKEYAGDKRLKKHG